MKIDPRTFLSSLSFFTIIFLGFSTNAEASTIFNRFLQVGSEGSDVKSLQIILNRDADTTITDLGPGSPGNETVFFGPKTRSAVIRFQEKYASDILSPNGLNNGTGYVGKSTLAKLEAISSPVSAPQPAATSTKSPTVSIIPISQGVIAQQDAFSAVTPKDLIVFGLSHTKVKEGDELLVTGFGFDQGTIAHFGQASSVPINSISGKDFTVKIPSIIPYGTYKFWVSNSRGSSNDTLNVIIGAETDTRPTIKSVTPSSVGPNDSISVIADALDSSNNTVYSDLGQIAHIPSPDGKTMQFHVSDLPNSRMFFQNKSINSFTVTFGVKTSQGLSLNYGYFTLKK